MKKKNNSGQIMLVFAFVAMAMFMFLLLVVYVSQLSRERIRLQTAADASALAMASFQARALNAIADRNFTLKYPSGDPQRRYGNPSPGDFSFPGIDQIDENMYLFSSKQQFLDVTRQFRLYQQQQDKFYILYSKLIPEIGKEYLKKNDSDASLVEVIQPSLQFNRQTVTVKYIDWSDVTGKKIERRESIDAWMENRNTYLYTFVRAAKEVTVWGQTFTFQVTALAEVVRNSGEVWPDPKPTYKSRLAPTQETGVLH